MMTFSLKIVFWNIRKNEDVQIIHELVEKSAADLLFLAECPENIATKSGLCEIEPPVTLSKSKVRGFRISNNYQITCVENGLPRLWFYIIEKDGQLFLLGTVHLKDKLV